MFKLVKILNTGAAYAEPITIKAGKSENYKIGSLLILGDNEVSGASALTKPSHVCGTEKPAGKEGKVTLYPIYPNMVFEAKLTEDPSSLGVGSNLTIYVNDEGYATALATASDNGPATVLEMAGASRVGDTVRVIFK